MTGWLKKRFWEYAERTRYEIRSPETGELYMVRYRLVMLKMAGRNLLNVYLHHILRSDDDRALHDHPWDFISFILAGGYKEVVEPTGETTPGSPLFYKDRRPGQVYGARAEHRHRVMLHQERPYRGPLSLAWPTAPPPEIPAWSLVITRPRRREWGFITPGGWVQWREYERRKKEGSA